MRSLRLRGGVGKDHGFGLKTFGAVYRHHPHLIARHLHVALHFALRGAQPGQETLQRRCLARLIVEREIEEFVERVIGLWSEAGEKLFAAAQWPQHMGEKCEGRKHARVLRQAVKSGFDRFEKFIAACLCAQAGAQRAFAVPGQLEQLFFGESEQRTLQHARQGQIVVFQQQAIGQRHQVHHRDVLGEHQPVGAGDRHAGIFQRADHGLEQRPALTHQHQHLAGFLAAVGPQLHMLCNPLRDLHARALLAHRVEGRVPAFDLASFRRVEQRPQLDQSGRGVGKGLMIGLGAIRTEALRMFQVANNTLSTAPSTTSPERNENSNLLSMHSRSASRKSCAN